MSRRAFSLLENAMGVNRVVGCWRPLSGEVRWRPLVLVFLFNAALLHDCSMLKLVSNESTEQQLNRTKQSSGDEVRPHPPELNCDDQERHKTLKIGSKIRLTCPVKSEDTYWVKWTKDGHEIKQGWTRYRISRRGVLHVSSTQASDAGTYVCQAINGFGTTEFTYQLELTVSASLPWFTPPIMENTTVVVGEPAFFRCHVISRIHQPLLQWYKMLEDDQSTTSVVVTFHGQRYAFLEQGTVAKQPDGSYLSKLKIETKAVNQSGLYVCAATNSVGFSYIGASLTVLPSQLAPSVNRVRPATGGSLQITFFVVLVSVLIFFFVFSITWACRARKKIVFEQFMNTSPTAQTILIDKSSPV